MVSRPTTKRLGDLGVCPDIGSGELPGRPNQSTRDQAAHRQVNLRLSKRPRCRTTSPMMVHVRPIPHGTTRKRETSARGRLYARERAREKPVQRNPWEVGRPAKPTPEKREVPAHKSARTLWPLPAQWLPTSRPVLESSFAPAAWGASGAELAAGRAGPSRWADSRNGRAIDPCDRDAILPPSRNHRNSPGHHVQ
jgi:hypothetical protein